MHDRERRAGDARDAEHRLERLREADRERGDRAGEDAEEREPAGQEARERMERLAEVDVVAAGVREARAKLRVRERAGEREQPADHPDREDQARVRQPLRDRAGREEDARADHRGHDQEHRVVERELATQAVPRVSVGGFAHAYPKKGIMQQRDDVHELEHRVDRRAGGVLVGIADGVARDGRLVGVAAPCRRARRSRCTSWRCPRPRRRSSSRSRRRRPRRSSRSAGRRGLRRRARGPRRSGSRPGSAPARP